MRAAQRKRLGLRTGLAFALIAGGGSTTWGQGSGTTPFTLSLMSSHSGGMLPLAQVNSGHGCKGGNAAPALQWSSVPPGTKSFALTMFDSTARDGKGFWHWAMFDIPGSARTLALGGKPQGARLGSNDFGDPGYGGACPPPGKGHQYHFTAWALKDATLPLADGAPDNAVGDYLKAHAIGKADLMLMYAR